MIVGSGNDDSVVAVFGATLYNGIALDLGNGGKLVMQRARIFCHESCCKYHMYNFCDRLSGLFWVSSAAKNPHFYMDLCICKAELFMSAQAKTAVVDVRRKAKGVKL